MNGSTEAQHSEFSEFLPDYAIGALSDGDLWRVEAHLETCASCQAEFTQVLDIVSVISPMPPPSAATKRALFERIGHPLPDLTPSADRPFEPIRLDAPARSSNIRRFPALLGRIALPAAAIVLIMLGGWNLWLQRELDDRNDLAALLTEPGSAHSLTDSEVQSDASAVIHVDPERDLALLTAQELPPLADGQRYQVWLFTEDGQRVGGGSFLPETDGSVVAVVEAPETFDTYWAVGVSIESGENDEGPTSPLIVGGWIR